VIGVVSEADPGDAVIDGSLSGRMRRSCMPPLVSKKRGRPPRVPNEEFVASNNVLVSS
jgi:hypothetical protein